MARMNRFARWMVNRRTLARAHRALAALPPDFALPPRARALELGCGGGGLIALLYERFHPARIVGTDLDPDQVDAARRFLATRWGTLPPSVELRPADALALPFEAGTFDVVFALMMFHHVEDHHGEFLRRPDALREVRRVLRPGGFLVYSEFLDRDRTRRTLGELGFASQFLRTGWRRDIAVYRAAGA